MQNTLFSADAEYRSTSQHHSIPLYDGELLYVSSFFSQQEADILFADLHDTIAWQHDAMKLYGKTIPFPRLSAWYGDAGAVYSFSGLTFDPHPWTTSLSTIKHRIEALAGVQFNSVLLNRYRTGRDYMGWHSDDERELGINPVIASVNLGAERLFQFRRKNNHREKIEIHLEHGSLLIMRGAIQHHWQHQLPKTAKPLGERINATFRIIHTQKKASI